MSVVCTAVIRACRIYKNNRFLADRNNGRAIDNL